MARWSAARAGPTKPETTVWPSERVAVKGRRVGLLLLLLPRRRWEGRVVVLVLRRRLTSMAGWTSALVLAAAAAVVAAAMRQAKTNAPAVRQRRRLARPAGREADGSRLFIVGFLLGSERGEWLRGRAEGSRRDGRPRTAAFFVSRGLGGGSKGNGKWGWVCATRPLGGPTSGRKQVESWWVVGRSV